jgi:phage terminase large subunit
MTKRDVNINFREGLRAFVNQRYDSAGELTAGHRGVVMEGSSRSGKSWSSIDLLIYIATRLHEGKSTCNIIRETYNSFKYTLYDDFDRRLRDYGLYSPFNQKRDVDWFYIHEMKINLLGADKPSKIHGAGSDYVWFNEAMHIPQAIFDQSEMRCRRFWMMDYNPSFTQHWVFNAVLNRPDVLHIHSTYLDNPHISPQERNKILSYEPTPENIANGTADEFNWKVYGLGERGQMKGKIFPSYRFVDAMPDAAYWYGLDFGFTVDPTALVRFADTGSDIYIQPLLYNPVDNAAVLSDTLDGMGIERHLPIIADSSDNFRGEVEMVRDLNGLGWSVEKVVKSKSVNYWLGKMKERRINIVRSGVQALDLVITKEFENYHWREVGGILVNEPAQSADHLIDAARYAYMGGLRDPGGMW